MGFNPRAMAFFILALASLGIAGFMFKNGDSLSNGLSFDLKIPTGWFISKEKNYVKADILINGTFNEVIPLKLENQDITIELPAESQLTINNMISAYLQPTTLILQKFEGKAHIMPYRIEILGKIESITDPLHVIKNVAPFMVQYNGSYSYLYITNIPSQTIVIPEYLGKIELYIKGDKVIYEVSNKDVEIKEFEGSIKVKDGRIEIQGSGLLRSDVLEVYAEE